MSHFVGLCFGENWENDIEKFDEGLQVEGYIAYTKEDAIQEAINRHSENYDWAVKTLDKDGISTQTYDHCTELVKKGPTLTPQEAWEIVKGWGYEMDENDNLISHYKPDSRWDWYSIGGRWAGYLPLKDRDEDGDPIETSAAYFDEIDWEYLLKERFTPFCYVDLDGDWHEKGEMGWFACVTNEKGQDCWDEEFKDFIKSLDCNCLVTVVDFHI